MIHDLVIRSFVQVQTSRKGSLNDCSYRYANRRKIKNMQKALAVGYLSHGRTNESTAAT